MQIVPTCKNVEAQIVEMKVPLYSYGCEKKVKKALSHLRGIHSIHVDYELQKVTVWGICDRDVVLATIMKKRRESRFWNHIDAGTNREEDSTNKPIDMAAAAGEEAGQAETTVTTGGSKSRRMWKKLFPLVLY